MKRCAFCIVAVVLATSGVVGSSQDARAQCGAKASSCSACHDGAHASSPSGDAWHANHAFADLCVLCHGGRSESNDVAEAHAGLADPLANTDACASCHGGDVPGLSARYRAIRSALGDAGSPALGSSASLSAGPLSSSPASMRGDRAPNALLAGTVGVIGAMGAFFVARSERRRRRRDVVPPSPATSS